MCQAARAAAASSVGVGLSSGRTAAVSSGQVAVALNAPEALLGFGEAGGGPPRAHVAVGPALDVAPGRERCTQPGGSCLPASEGGYLDSSALRRCYVAALKRADLRALRFYDLCHIFGSLAINYASIVPV